MTAGPLGSEVHREGRGWRIVLLIALGLWLWITVPLALGTRTLVARDVFTIHLPLKWFGAEELRHGRIPAFNPTWGGGQPFRGNPNALAWYPGNLLYLVLPFWSAFNLHYMLHWLLAFLALRALARRLGQSPAASLASAFAYAGSGYLLSALMYYNLLPVVAWWPVVLCGAARGDRRGLALAGVACGMALLAGEPLTAALGLVPLLLVLYRGRLREALVRCAAIGALGVVVALPQVVSTWRALPFTYRFVHGLGAVREELSRVPLFRLLELVVPLPYGHPFLSGPAGFKGYDVLPDLPLVMTLHFGIVALVLAGVAARVRRRWTLLAAAGLVVPMALTLFPSAVERLSGGFARYPEKFLLWFALAAALLTGWGLERVLGDRALGVRALRIGALALGALAIAAFLGRAQAAAWIDEHARRAAVGAAAAQLGIWLFFLLFGALLLLLAGWALRRGSATGVLLAQLAGLVPLGVLLPTDATAPYREPGPWVRALPPGAAVFNGSFVTALGAATIPYRLPDGRLASVRRLAALDLLPAPGVLHGLRYPLAPDYDGMISWPVARILGDFPALSWEQRLPWLRSLGVDAAVLTTTEQVPGLRTLDTVDRAGVTTVLAGVEGRSPIVWWPRSLVGADTPEAAYARSLMLDDPVRAAVVVGAPPAHDAEGAAVAVTVLPDRIVIDTRGGGGVAAVGRAFQPQFRARTQDGRTLPTLALDFALLGIVVPPGEHRVVVEVSSRPEIAAAVIAILALSAGLAVAAGLPRPRRPPGVPR